MKRLGYTFHSKCSSKIIYRRICFKWIRCI